MPDEPIGTSTLATLAAKAAAIQDRYHEERTKRIELRPEGIAQYIDLSTSEKHKHYQEDLFFDRDKPLLPVPEHAKFLIVGAGFGGLLFAIRLIQTGILPSDIRIIEKAGGFGGTWYFNRYPGLMCDVESYIYLPLLEEMGYMPKHKYSYGTEILDYVNSLVSRWGLNECGVFRQQVKSGKWDNERKQWAVEMESIDDKINRTIRAEFMLIAPGVLSTPKLPGIPGIDDYQGHSFHTSRWDYSYTGGSPSHPYLENLKDKTVGIIGTGATTVQTLPHLAKYSKKLYVFQRTPSSIDVRGQMPTDPEEWKSITKQGNGWQRQRSDNFSAYIAWASPLPKTNLVNDGWSSMTTYCAVVGTEQDVTPEKVPEYLTKLHGEDMMRAERIRARVDEKVVDKNTAQKLKHWYPSWCKRPCFHDEYLETFNQPNVTLIDTAGKGVDRITSTGLVVGDQEYPVDVIIFSTGFVSPSTGNAAPTTRAGITITGKDGADLQDKLTTVIATLHGVCSRSFPNLFWPGPLQGGTTANQSRVLDEMAIHVAYIIAKASERGDKVIIEPTAEAEEQWAFQILSMSASGAAMIGCTPSYINLEGAVDKILELTPEEQMKAGRAAIWGRGLLDFVRVIETWRANGGLSGLEVTAVV